MNANATIIAAFVGFVGLIVGGYAQYFYGRRAEVTKQLQSLKNQAYVDFVKSVAGVAIAQKAQNKEKELEFSILLADAKSRIAVYGDKEVVEGIATFYRMQGCLRLRKQCHHS